MFRRSSLRLVVVAVVSSLSACMGHEEGQDLLTAETLTGEIIRVDASKICWNTRTPIPEGYSAVADPSTKSFRIVPIKTDKPRAMLEEAVDAIDSGEGGTGTITCTCTSGGGGCSPAKFGSDVYCVMSTCSTCKKS